MIRCEKHKDLLLCSINTCFFPPSALPLSCRRDMFIYLRALFKNKIKAFHRAFAQLLLLLLEKKSLLRVNLQRFRKRGRQRSLMPSIN